MKNGWLILREDSFFLDAHVVAKFESFALKEVKCLCVSMQNFHGNI